MKFYWSGGFNGSWGQMSPSPPHQGFLFKFLIEKIGVKFPQN
jgi:hypothetical protein